jgi:TP901 family phage tail tape measure protein
MNLGDVWVAIRPDLKAFASDLSKGSEEAGDKAGDAAGQHFNISMARVVKAGRAIAGAIFTAAAAGALEMEKLRATYVAATGATEAEAEAWARMVNDVSRTSVHSLQDIAAASTIVRKELGLTGEAQRQATEWALDFARATEAIPGGAIPAADAIALLGDATSAWGQDASAIPELMDKLVRSEQLYGGSLRERLLAIKELGPALQVLGVSQDQEIGLLNLLSAAGIEATDMRRGLNRAIASLPPDTNLVELLNNLQLVADDGQRARLAVQAFGTDLGPKLAQALAPGKDSLADFMLTTDQTRDATIDAGAALDRTWGSRFTALINGAKADIRGLGMEFGPAGSIVAGLAAMAPAVRDSLALLGVNPSVIGAAHLAGGLVGGEFGLAFQLAAIVAIPAAVLKALQIAANEAQRFLSEIFGGSGKSSQDLMDEVGRSTGQRSQPLGPPLPAAVDGFATGNQSIAPQLADALRASGVDPAVVAAATGAGTSAAEYLASAFGVGVKDLERDPIKALVEYVEGHAYDAVSAFEQDFAAQLGDRVMGSFANDAGIRAAMGVAGANHASAYAKDFVRKAAETIASEQEVLFAGLLRWVGTAGSAAGREFALELGRSASVPSLVPRR